MKSFKPAIATADIKLIKKAITFYLNKNWCWDWGGILHIGVEDDSLNSIFPKYNRLVVHDMKKFRFPHFISPVTDYAKSSRYTIVSFNK